MTTAGAIPAIAALPTSKARTIGLGLIVLAGPSLIGIVPLAIVPSLPALTADFASSGGGILTGQMVLTLPAIMIMIAAPAAGVLVARFGLRTALVALLLLYAVAGSAGFYLTGLSGLIATRLLLGLAAGTVAAISTALAGLYFHGPSREHLLGYMAAAPGLFAVLVLSLSGWLVDNSGWRTPFALYLLAVPVAVLAAMLVDRRPPDAPKSPAGRRGDLLVLWPLYGLLVLFSIGMFMLSVHGTFLLGELGVASATTGGMLLSLPLLAVVVTGLSFGLVRKHIANRWLIVACPALLGIGIGLSGLATSIVGFAVGTVFFGFGCGLVYPVLSSIILHRVAQSSQPRAAGLITSGIFLGQLLNPFVVAPLRGLAGLGASFVIVGAALLVTALALAARPPQAAID